MRTFDQIADDASDRTAFSNGVAWELWSFAWCERCIHDTDGDCPIVTVAMVMEKTPREWQQVGVDNYDCIDFQPKECL